MKFIGLTGGVGAGESEILSYIRKHYRCEIYLADEVAHEVKNPGTECYHELIKLLGEDILESDGQIDRGKMAEKIFADETVRQKVNGIIHPAVKRYLLEHLETAEKRGDVELFFVEAALLIEAGYGELVDEMWYIYATEEVRRERLKLSRGYSDEKVNRILASQLSDEEFRQNCSFIIDNSGELTDSFKQIDEKLEAYTWQN